MRHWIFIVVLLCSINRSISQCPDGARPSFWHPEQVDSFNLLYPNCDRYNFQSTMINGEYVKPIASSSGNSITYVIMLIAILISIIFLLKLLTSRVKYFR